MKIGAESNHFCPLPRAQAATAARTAPASFSSASTAANAETSIVERIDFTSMTRQELFDWMNDQIRNGKMSLHEAHLSWG